MYDRSVRFNHVQALRFFAAAAVVLGHSVIFWHMQYPNVIADATRDYFGWAGGWSVSLFFCISGFVITHSSRGQTPLSFIVVRLLRIYPAFWIACLLAAAIKLFLFHGLSWSAEGYGLKQMLLIPAGQQSYPLRVEWSLVYEVFFYVVIALFLFIPGRRTVLYASFGWLAIIVISKLIGFDYAERYPAFPAIIASSRNLPFIGGVLVYFYSQSALMRRIYAFLPIWALAVALFAQVTHSTFGVIVTQAISSMLLLTYTVQRDHLSPIDSKNIFVKLGDASYGLYLFHITVITVVLAVWTGSYAWQVTLSSLFIFGMSFGLLYGVVEQRLYHAIKKPFMRLFQRSTMSSASKSPSTTGGLH